MTIKEITVPDIGNFDEVEIIEVLVSPGDTIAAEDSLITLESDKASMEIPSTDSGVVKEVLVNVGDMITSGGSIIKLEVGEPAAAAASNEAEPTAVETGTVSPEPSAPVDAEKAVPMPSAPAEAAPPEAEQRTEGHRPPPTRQLSDVSFTNVYASPAVRKFARELGVDLNEVEGSGRKGRILREDVQGYVKKALSSGVGGGMKVAPMPEVDFSQWGDVATKPLSKINRLTGEFLHRNWVTIPHVTQFDEADITDLESFRKSMADEYKEQGIKITLLSFLMKAVVSGLKAMPRFNASLDASGENLILKQYYNIGIAVDTPDGLVVPVVRDVDRKTLVELATDLRDISIKARDKKLTPVDMQGGCMTISSLGGIGGTQFTPIVNAPEVAILGVSRSKMQPVWNGEAFEPRLILPLSLSYDHRVIDGADGARFTSFLSRTLSDTRRLLL